MDLARDKKNSHHTLIKTTICNFSTFTSTSTHQEQMHSLPEGRFCPPTAPLRPKQPPCSNSLKTISRQLREAGFPLNSTEDPIPDPAPLPLLFLPPLSMYTYPHIQRPFHPFDTADIFHQSLNVHVMKWAVPSHCSGEWGWDPSGSPWGGSFWHEFLISGALLSGENKQAETSSEWRQQLGPIPQDVQPTTSKDHLMRTGDNTGCFTVGHTSAAPRHLRIGSILINRSSCFDRSQWMKSIYYCFYLKLNRPLQRSDFGRKTVLRPNFSRSGKPSSSLIHPLQQSKFRVLQCQPQIGVN